MSLKTPALLVGVCVLAGAAGFGIYHLQKGAAAPAAAIGSAAATNATAPEAAPSNIKLTDLAGNSHSLEEFRGKLLVVNFWATWCTPCLHEIPALKKIQDDYGARGLQIVGPAVDDIEEVRKAGPGLAFNYPIYVGSAEEMLDLMTKFGNSEGGLPFSVVIGPDGTILQRQLGEFSAVELAGLAEEHLPKQP